MKFAHLFAPLMASIIAAPAMADEVNVYSYRQPELIAPLMDAFTAETGIKVNVAFLKSGLVERLAAEGDRSPADLIFTVDIGRLAGVVNAGLTQAVQSDVLTDNIPAEYRDPDQEWFGLTTRARVFFTARDRVSDGEIASYEDLADPKWAGRICTRSGTHAYTLAMVAAYMHHHGEDATRIWAEAFKANLAHPPKGNDRGQVKSVWAGECDVAIGNTYYMGKMVNNPDQVAWADAVNVVFPVFEGSGTHVNVSGMALAAHAPHRDAAVKLMEYLASPAAQEIYASDNYEYPVAPGTSPSALVQSWGSFTADGVNLMDVADLRAAALKLMQEVDFDG